MIFITGSDIRFTVPNNSAEEYKIDGPQEIVPISENIYSVELLNLLSIKEGDWEK